MKKVGLFGLVITGLLMTGCDTTRPSEPIAGAEGSKTAAPAGQPSPQSDPASNGGSSLAVSTPYDGGGKTVAQNVNPAPFLVGSPAPAPGTTGTVPPPNSLASRADGTMYGANDQPAASTSWGTHATNWSSSAAAPAAKPQKKKK